MKYLEYFAAAVKVEIIVRDGCHYSERVLTQLPQIQSDFPRTRFEVVDVSKQSKVELGRGGITPSVWVNDKLLFLGTFNAEKLYVKLGRILDVN